MVIREETPADAAAISALNREAFENDAEAKLVDRLRAAGALTLSLVAEADTAIVGHIALSPVTIHDGGGTRSGLGLGPMAVRPSHQRQGIGSELINRALAEVKSQGHGIVVVVGHPEYYPRFGFLPAVDFGLRWEHEVPVEVFMVKELKAGTLRASAGVVKYRPEFDDV